MTEPDIYDVAILGGGPGGTAAAGQVARRGRTACLIEAGRLGGVCLHVGCIPTKAMLAASGLCWQMGRAEQFGLDPCEPTVDGAAFMRRVRDVVCPLAEATDKAMAAAPGVRVVRGRGRLGEAGTVEVDTQTGAVTVRARSIIVATGARAVRPSFLPWDCGRIDTSDEATGAIDLPASLLVIGGGVIGCELATVTAELGIRTHLVEMLDRLLPNLDKDASKAAVASLEARGAEVLTGRRVAGAEGGSDGVAVELDDGRRIDVDRVLVAVGRRANIEDIGLADAGVATADGIIPVDDRCRTNVEGIYAVGDVAEARQYAHLADRMGIIAADNALGDDRRDDRTVVPVGAYTHPEIASVGVGLDEARATGRSARVYRTTYRASGMARAAGTDAGMLKVVADPDDGLIHGALWIGPHATDMIHELALAMRHGLTLAQVGETIHAHPTFQEAAGAVAAAWDAQARRRRP